MKNKIILAGAAPDTNNLGVSALHHATISNLKKHLKDTAFTALDNGMGIRNSKIQLQTGALISTQLNGAKHGRRFYQNENLTNIRACCKFGGLFNPIAIDILNSKAIIDISGGDSFTDLYGEWRFNAIILPKLIAIENNIPLILLPQTYGPYNSKACKYKASEIIKQSHYAWARDNGSFEELKNLLGGDFDKSKHFEGVDVAFLLESHQPINIPENLIKFLDSPEPTIGINISGLIYNDIENSKNQYGFKADYKKVIKRLIQYALKNSDANICLIPHVLVNNNHYESDIKACTAAMIDLKLNQKDAKRIIIVERNFNQCEIKWIISQMSWFCGTRMHSTIAALSTQVPTSAIAYSLKTLRVFKTCGQGNQVVDPRVLSTNDTVDNLIACWQELEKTKSSLQRLMPSVLTKAQKQFEQIALSINTL